MIKLLIILKLGTSPQANRSITINGVDEYGVFPGANGSQIFYYTKFGNRSFIPSENVIFFGDYCRDLINI